MTALTSETRNSMGLYKNRNPCFGSQGNQQNSSDRNARLSTARSRAGTAGDLFVQKNWLIITVVNIISTAFLVYFTYS